MRSLLLNSDWTPLNFISEVRAMKLIFKGRAEVISLGEKPSIWKERYRSVNASFEVPATIRLVDRVNRRYSAPRFRKHVLFNRDGWTCQYCGVQLDRSTVTIDHITPRAQGGTTCWRNCVSSCKKCNWKKGPRTPSEAGMRLRKQPVEPRVIHFWDLKHRVTWHEDWSFFLGVNT